MIQSLWQKAFDIAKRDAQAEMQRRSPVQALSWQEVFQEEYGLDDSDEVGANLFAQKTPSGEFVAPTSTLLLPEASSL